MCSSDLTVKSEVEREMQFEDLKKLQQHIHAQQVQAEPLSEPVKKPARRKPAAKRQTKRTIKKSDAA